MKNFLRVLKSYENTEFGIIFRDFCIFLFINGDFLHYLKYN